MKIRPMNLPRGWYPLSSRELTESLEGFGAPAVAPRRALAAIVPHAGWYYSGSYAYQGFSSLDPDCDCLIIFGGHRPPGSAPLLALEDGFDSPEGVIEADKELRCLLQKELETEEDRFRDNTVEVLLPLVKRLFPGLPLLWLRVPNDTRATDIGKRVAELAISLGRKPRALGSTDLTHYGLDYGFCPQGLGDKALAWVREVNDKKIVDAFLAMDGPRAIGLGESDSSACSAGAAAAAIAFASCLGAGQATLLGYGTSADIEPADRFVGYASVCYQPS